MSAKTPEQPNPLDFQSDTPKPKTPRAKKVMVPVILAGGMPNGKPVDPVVQPVAAEEDPATTASSVKEVPVQPPVAGMATEPEAAKPNDASKTTPASSSAAPEINAPIQIPIALLDAHPQNPRLGLHEPTVAAQAAQMQARGEFDIAHAITVRRKSGGRYEIIYGHTRVEAARRAGLAQVWAFVVEMDDAEAYLALAAGNMQEPLTHLEIAVHSLGAVVLAQGKRGLGLAEYARRVGLQPSNLRRYRDGGEVFQAVREELGAAATSDNFIRGCRDRAEQLAVIHRTNRRYWVELVNWLVENRATIDQTKDKVRTYLPAGEESDEAGSREDGGDAPEQEKPAADGQGLASPPGRESGDVAPVPGNADGGQVSPTLDHATPEVPAPTAADAEVGQTTSQATNGAVGAKLAVTEGATTVASTSGGDDRLTAAAQVFQTRWEGVSQLRRIFRNVRDPVLRRALSAWDNRLVDGRQAPHEEMVQHLATQDDLARRLAEVERECAVLVAAAPRGHRKIGDTVASVLRQHGAFGRDLLPAHVADAEHRLGELRVRLANIRTPIEIALDTIARRP